MFKIGTLRLNIPFGGVIFRAAPILVLIVLGCEVILRVPQAQSKLLLPVLSGHYEMGPKETLASRMDGIDCFFVGNSSVGKSVMPEVFDRAYQAETGQAVRCFNFGMDGLSLQGGQELIRILAKRYHPRLIIYGIHYTNFTTSGANSFDMDAPWARYALGRLDFEGWLEGSLMSYRYTLTYTQNAVDLERSVVETGLLTRDGYKPNGIIEVQYRRPERARDPDFFDTLDGYDVPGTRHTLSELLSTRDAEPQIVLVDMPIPPTTLRAFTKHRYDYDAYLSAIYEEAAAYQVVFIPAIPANLIPDDGYQDPIHLNDRGAAAFSVWLGQQVGVGVGQGQIANPGR